ncbi:MAG: BON domain-containing protein [Ktedonobacteraceae bacterium]
MISALHHFQWGQSIRCSDGDAGVLTGVLFDPVRQRVIALRVRLGRLFGRNAFVSFVNVGSVTEDGITLAISYAELAASAKKAAPLGVLLDSKSVVEAETTSEAMIRGNLHSFVVQPESGELAYLVVHHFRPGQESLLRGEYVTQIETGRVKVALPEALLHTLPQYHPDRELQQAVEERLSGLSFFHTDFTGMTIRVLDGVLSLTGNISSALNGDIIQDQAMGVEGVGEIKNALIGDDTLANTVAMAIGHDPRTHGLPIGVYPRLGHVHLHGVVQNEQQKAAAEDITRRVSGVRSVSNTLVVNPTEEMLHVLSSTEEGPGEDLIPGTYIRHTG